MNLYTVLSIQEIGEFRNFESAILVKVNPVTVINNGFRDMANFCTHECDETKWILFNETPYSDKLNKLVKYAKMCESQRYMGLDFENWFDKEDIFVNDGNKRTLQTVYFARFRKVDVGFPEEIDMDEMDYFYLHERYPGLEEYEEEIYRERQRNLRAQGKMYDDVIDYEDDDEFDFW